MAINKTNKIDFIRFSLEKDYVILTIADEWDWEDEGFHLAFLQEKLNKYIAYIESGEIYENNPEFKNKRVLIDIFFKHQLTKNGVKFLKVAKETIASNLRVSLSWQVKDD